MATLANSQVSVLTGCLCFVCLPMSSQNLLSGHTIPRLFFLCSLCNFCLVERIALIKLTGKHFKPPHFTFIEISISLLKYQILTAHSENDMDRLIHIPRIGPFTYFKIKREVSAGVYITIVIIPLLFISNTRRVFPRAHLYFLQRFSFNQPYRNT